MEQEDVCYVIYVIYTGFRVTIMQLVMLQAVDYDAVINYQL